ncbi:MAG: tetratricopeptide repeat protein, partial [Bacteroidia bacterium]
MKLLFKSILLIALIIPTIASGQFWKKNKADKGENAAGFVKTDKFRVSFFEGMRAYGLENYDNSISAFEECLKLDPNSVAVNYQLSKVYSKKGLRSKAIEYAQKGFN